MESKRTEEEIAPLVGKALERNYSGALSALAGLIIGVLTGSPIAGVVAEKSLKYFAERVYDSATKRFKEAVTKIDTERAFITLIRDAVSLGLSDIQDTLVTELGVQRALLQELIRLTQERLVVNLEDTLAIPGVMALIEEHNPNADSYQLGTQIRRIVEQQERVIRLPVYPQLLNEMERSRNSCRTLDTEFRIPNLLSAVLASPDSKLLQKVMDHFDTTLFDMIAERTANFLKKQSTAGNLNRFTPFDWSSLSPVTRADWVALKFKATSIHTNHIAVGILTTSSNTSAILKGEILRILKGDETRYDVLVHFIGSCGSSNSGILEIYDP